RADVLRQHFLGQWSARQARFTTSSFHEPHFAIAASKLVVTAEEGPGKQVRHRVEAEDIGVDIGGRPVFRWPHFTGDGGDVPIRSVDIDSSKRDGVGLRTEWDLFALLDKEKAEGVDVSLLLDGFSKRGPGIGLEIDYDREDAFGEFEGYYLHDEGEDEPGGRGQIDPSTTHRGRLLWRHRQHLPDDWEATLQLAWLSDPNFLEEFYHSEALAEKEQETSIYLKQQRDDWAFTFLARYDLQDFIPQTDLLQTQGNIVPAGSAGAGYGVEKFPELSWRKIGGSFLSNRLTWFSENRASVMRLRLPDDSPADRSFTTAQSVALFGMAAATTPFDTALRAAGLDEHRRLRGDSRQEIQAPMRFGAVNVVPYVVGRITAYDDDFVLYAGEGDNVRLWGAAGVRVNTSFSRVYEDAQSELLDIHRIRHIVEPSVHLFVADTNINQAALPVYDYDVESLAEGATAKFGLRNTLQTQRGGEGRWRSVDVLRIDTSFVLSGSDAVIESPLAKFFDYRPELSLAGDHVFNEVAWQVTDTFAFVGNANHSFESDRLEQWNVGIVLDHDPDLSTYVNLRHIEALDSLLLRYGIRYILTPKYELILAQSFDLETHDNRNLSLTMTRRLPRWLLIIHADFDQVTDDASIGVALSPQGLDSPFKPATQTRVNTEPNFFERDL
ncbi:MAG: LPS assembly protein LptD, partial [Phycisphaerae bacterium]|nr:LPS assembly protein LptD [Phycisphaerae bacterium]